MKRSLINRMINECKNMLAASNYVLPPFAYWSMERWYEHRDKIEIIHKTMLGWDITDFGSQDFFAIGAVLFTIRNGEQKTESKGTPYAEKIIFCKDGQRLPLHFHMSKTEDIINRGGGILSMRLYNANYDNSVDENNDILIFLDGIPTIKKAGEPFDIPRGASATLTPRMYHIFGAKAGCGDLLVGEVSSVNDDKTDNFFAEPVSRFAEIWEDELPIHPLCNEYESIIL